MVSSVQSYFVEDKLPDGSSVTIRALCPDDKVILQRGMHHLSERSRYYRFFTAKDTLTDAELVRFTELDLSHHVGLICILKKRGKDIPIGVGRYILSEDCAPPRGAELAFAVDEKFQGLGVGTLLLKHLTRIGRLAGIDKFIAFVLPENHRMLHVFAHSGLTMEKTLNSAGVYEVTLHLLSRTSEPPDQ